MVDDSHLYCLQCGAANLPHAKFCVVCGHSLQGDASIPLPAIPKAPALTPQSSLVQHTLLKQRYRILAPIGTGGFAEVYKAADQQFGGRLVAIKAMGIDGLSAKEVSEATETFQQEAFLLANLVHPNLPAIYDYFYESQHWYLVMSFIEGTTLEEYVKLRGGRLPVEKVLPVGIQLCAVLDYLHKRQPAIIFRDLKLTNVMRTPERQLYLIDFGVARLFKDGKARDTIALGSPGYAAPEQYGKAQTTPQADVYSLGAVLHALLSGSDPSDAPFHFVPLQIPMYPDLNALIMSMVENDARRRPFSMSQVKQELQRIALGQSSAWAQQNWQNNVLHYASESKSPSPSSSISPGLRPLQGPNINQKKPLQNRGRDSQPRPTPLSPSAQRPMPGGQQIMYQPPLPMQPAHAHGVSRRVMIAGGLGGLLVSGGLFTYLMAQMTRPDRFSEQPSQPPMSLAAREPVQTPEPAFNPAALFAVAWSPDGRRIITGSGSGKVNVLDSSGHLINTYSGHNAEVTGLAWSSNSKWVASASYDTTVQIWNPATDKTLITYRNDNGAVDALSWSPNGKYIVSADDTDMILVWDANSQQTLQRYTGQREQVNALSWSHDSTYIASGSTDYTVQVWRALNGKMILNYQGHTSAVRSVAWSPGSTRIASASDDQTVRVWDALSGNNVYVYSGHSAPVTVVAWSPDGRYLATGSQDRTIQVWQPTDGRLLYVYDKHTNAVLSLDWSPFGNIVSTDADGNMRIWMPLLKG